ncbi:cell wall elongation regulator TseB-like domain-containing protein [Paenibacillus cremeus]|uniref:Cell wall elongation regulator TseB-like domain-containing protein n=1 Tax=Paenibacillus cremeus TaxID=2163881 RepID=A0A559KHP1_9BACL|nr:DUF5590 domain-containing protein [Paenibacillus cremeus]TVY11657.1 hypothetical protein FPZ49_02845 [Paenibacillus cremeus]
MGTGRKWKVWLLTVAILVGAVILASWMFTTVMDDEWGSQREAVQSAYEKTILTKAVKVDRFVGEKSYTVIQGEDKIGQPVLVWVGQDEVRSEMASNGITAEQAQNQTLAKQPDAEVLRVTPGMMNGTAVWEVFYKQLPEGEVKEQYYYDYYRFADGQPVDTWRLSIQ